MKTKPILGALMALSICGVAQNNVFPTPSGLTLINASGAITNPTNRLEVYGTGANNIGVGGTAPVINFYGGATVPPLSPTTAITSPYAKVALATSNNGFVNTAVAGDLVIQNMGMSPTPITGNGKSIVFSSRYEDFGGLHYNGVEHMRINESGNVGIGIVTPGARLHVVGTTLGVRGDAGTNINNTGVFGTGYYGIDGSGNLVGARGNCFTAGGSLNQGVRGNASSGTNNIGGYFQVGGGSSGIVGYGVYSEIANPTSGGTNYGIYATVGSNHYSGAGPNYAGYFNGDVVTAGGSYFYSDGRIKKDIKGIDNSMGIIKQLNPVNYNFDLEGNKNLALPEEKQYGFISQEIQKILPEFTKTLIHPAQLDENGKEISPKKEVLGLNYNGFIALLTKGIQEQQKIIEDQALINLDQQKQLDEQKQLISELKSSTATGINNLNNVETGFQMSQNEPNPFTHETVVKYTLPQTIGNAFMAVYDLTGKQITTFPINEKGSSSLTITSEKLAAGIYIYSIVADGKVIDSKRMIVAEK